MGRLEQILRTIRSSAEPPNVPQNNPFKLACRLADPALPEDVNAAWGNEELPNELMQLWRLASGARLYEDVDYGQWGLEILSPEQSALRTRRERETRPEAFGSDDFVVGEFLGDQDLLVLVSSGVGERRVLVALPLDARPAWYSAGADLGDFIARYVETGGDKYWESDSGVARHE